MKNWNNYKDYVKNVDESSRKEMESIEILADLISEIIEKRNELGLSQRDLADLCDMPQSSIARIEGMKIMPNIDTLIRVLQPLGLKLTIQQAN